jgi:hypothetical protein
MRDGHPPGRFQSVNGALTELRMGIDPIIDRLVRIIRNGRNARSGQWSAAVAPRPCAKSKPPTTTETRPQDRLDGYPRDEVGSDPQLPSLCACRDRNASNVGDRADPRAGLSPSSNAASAQARGGGNLRRKMEAARDRRSSAGWSHSSPLARHPIRGSEVLRSGTAARGRASAEHTLGRAEGGRDDSSGRSRSRRA